MTESPRPSRRSYGQRCALAKALDVVGERWTLLIVRDLLVGPRRFGEILRGLPGLTTNLLSKRLQEMSERGLLTQTERHGVALYTLTDLGRALEPALMALADWGDVVQLPKNPADVLDARWGVLSLKRRYRGGFSGVVAVELRKPAPVKRYWARADGTSLEVTDQPGWSPTLTVSSSDEEALLRTLLTRVDWKPWLENGVLTIGGRMTDFRAFLRSLGREGR